MTQHRLPLADPTFSLAQTCGPVAWAGGRWPNVDWRDERLIWVGWEDVDHLPRPAVRIVAHEGDALIISGDRDIERDAEWVAAILAPNQAPPSFPHDHRLQALADRYARLRPFSNGSLVEGLIGSIVGQSISVASAATTQRRLAELFTSTIQLHDRMYWPLPTAAHLADATPAQLRETGVTWRRAEALVAVGRAAVSGTLPTSDEALANPDTAYHALQALPCVGPWTARSTLLWGLGAPDAHPTGDVALLRGARLIYDQPALTLKTLDDLAESWRPWRGWAARFVWTAIFGPAPSAEKTYVK